MNKIRPLPIIAGPTGVGKTGIAIEVAKQTGASIISADSMQVYRGLAIGTAQPTSEELAAVRHHLIGHVAPGEEYHVARFVREAEHILDAESHAGKPVIVCGGTGLFLRHLVHGIFQGAPRSPEIRTKLQHELEQHGADALRQRLRTIDPVRESEINPNDTVRVLRALEVYELTGVPMSHHHQRDAAERESRPVKYFVLNRPREELYARIEARVDQMIDQGWLQEAQWLMSLGLPDDSQACKALGYRELFRHLRGELSLEAAIAEIKMLTRRFAKRQLTWFRGVPDARWLDLGEIGTEGAVEIIRDQT